MTKSKNDGIPWRAMGLVTALGLDIAACTLLGFYVGRWVGKMNESVPLGTGLGVLIGVIVGVINVIVLIKKVLEEPDG